RPHPALDPRRGAASLRRSHRTGDARRRRRARRGTAAREGLPLSCSPRAGICPTEEGGMKKGILLAVGLAGLAAAVAVLAATGGSARTVAAINPLVTDYTQVSASTTPPTEMQCFTANSDSGGRRCFTPASIRSAYNLGTLLKNGTDGRGQ